MRVSSSRDVFSNKFPLWKQADQRGSCMKMTPGWRWRTRWLSCHAKLFYSLLGWSDGCRPTHPPARFPPPSAALQLMIGATTKSNLFDLLQGSSGRKISLFHFPNSLLFLSSLRPTWSAAQNRERREYSLQQDPPRAQSCCINLIHASLFFLCIIEYDHVDDENTKSHPFYFQLIQSIPRDPPLSLWRENRREILSLSISFSFPLAFSSSCKSSFPLQLV